MNPLADTVRQERLSRGWSVRTAASRGGISNTWWSRFEDGLQPLTPAIGEAVAEAFDWPATWAATPPGPADQSAVVMELVRQVAELTTRVEEMGAELAKMRQPSGRAARGSR